MLVLSIVGIGMVIFNALFILSACKVASRSDQWEEEMLKEVKDETYII